MHLPSHPLFLVAALGAFLVPGRAAAQDLAPSPERLEVRTTPRGEALVYRGPADYEYVVAVARGAVERPSLLERDGTVAITWEVEGRPWYAVSLDGGLTFGRPRSTPWELTLRYGTFDPLQDAEPEVEPFLMARADHRLFIVQYVAKGLEPWREEIRAMGAEDLRFLAWHANIWRMDLETAARVAELPFVRWVGAFHPAYKMEDAILADWRAGRLTEPARYRIVVGAWGLADKQIVAGRVEEIGGTVEAMIPQGLVLEATLSPAQLVEVLHMSEVLGVDRWSAPEDDMDIVRARMGADYIEATTYGFSGQGVRAEVMDGNLDSNHPDWANAPLWHGSRGGDDSHGTCTFGINFGAGNSSAGARGLCPDAQGIFADYGYLSNRYTHTQQLVSSPYFGVYQSNSWGGSRTRAYNSTSQEMDDIIYLYDIVITQSQSNAGNQDSRPQAWAKNIVAVGGLRHYNDQNDANDAWAGSASIGPAADGRVKPDLCGYYDWVHTSDADPGGYVGGSHYTNFGGTSAASPIVAGHFGLFFEMWHRGIFGNPTGATVFDSRPHSTTARAAMINAAYRYPLSQTDITRYNQGWGRPDLKYLYDNRGLFFYVDEQDVLRDQQSKSYTVTVPAGAGEFRATLVYMDRAGTTSSTLHRINDLSLKVTDPSGTVWWGNYGLMSSNTNSPGGSSDTKNVVENVFLVNPTPGQWTIEVFADEVNQDTHGENGTNPPDADYALVVTPVDIGGCGLVNTIQLSGPNIGFPGARVNLSYSNAPGSAPYWIYYSLANTGSIINGHCFDVGPGVKTAGTGTTAATGDGSWMSPIIPGRASGRTIYLEMRADSGGNTFDSNVHVLDIL